LQQVRLESLTYEKVPLIDARIVASSFIPGAYDPPHLSYEAGIFRLAQRKYGI
jgi:hypothetical protein